MAFSLGFVRKSIQRDDTPGAIFTVVAGKVFDIVTSNNNSKHIDVVFDVYKDISIKNAERAKRSSGSEGVSYKNIMPGYQIKT